MSQLLDIIDYLIENNIIHRDINPNNIMIDNDINIKLIDFGCAKDLTNISNNIKDSNIINNIISKSYTGTPLYISPELLEEDSNCKSPDIWSFGVIMYEMILGKLPFESENNTIDLYEKIYTKDLIIPNNLEHNVKDILSKLLIKDKTKRIGCQENGIKDIKNHIFFKSYYQTKYNNTIQSLEKFQSNRKKVSFELCDSDNINITEEKNKIKNKIHSSKILESNINNNSNNQYSSEESLLDFDIKIEECSRFYVRIFKFFLIANWYDMVFYSNGKICFYYPNSNKLFIELKLKEIKGINVIGPYSIEILLEGNYSKIMAQSSEEAFSIKESFNLIIENFN